MKQRKVYDLAVIGGGVNGCGIANDAAGRGLSTILFEQSDFSSGTSSASTKLIHGGLRYLEQYEFRLVRESLKERELLLNKAPHIIWPLKFVMPYHKGLRPFWLIRLGVWLYDHLTRLKALPPSYSVKFADHVFGKPLKTNFQKGLVYSDCWVEDSRLVVLNAVQARQNGAEVYNRCKVEKVEATEQGFRITARHILTDTCIQVFAKGLVNATGPWVKYTVDAIIQARTNANVRLVQGSHIIIPRLYEGEQCYVLQNVDKRIIFVIPYCNDFTLIGTTDVVLDSLPEQAQISAEEKSYLVDSVNAYFNTAISADAIVASYAGIRPLFNDANANPSEITRDYHLELNTDMGFPLLNIFGGKITTYRKLAEHALEKLKPYYPDMKQPWTADAALPGGDFKPQQFEALFTELKQNYPYIAGQQLYRYLRFYGKNAFQMLQQIQKSEDLGRHFGADLYQLEVDYLIENEYAKHAEDILWRRTKLALNLSKEEVRVLADYTKQKLHLAVVD